jgi:carbonic anhydrase/acetyltransferase-like protein (isoleucine patch superfamily)
MNVSFGDHQPSIDPGAWVAPNATVIGAAGIAAGASLWFGCVIRADADRIDIGRGSNVQDNCVLHADPGFPCRVGEGVSIGHGAVVHGCTIEDHVLIGMNATVMNGAVVGSGSIVAAGALVTQGTVVPPGSLVAGVPGKVRRPTTDQEREQINRNAANYLERMRAYLDKAERA